MKPRLIATDLDGTLFFSSGHVTERTVAAVQACLRATVPIVIATARPFLSVQTRLDERLQADTYWICNNGGALYRDGTCLAEDALSPEVALDALRVLYATPHDFVISIEMGGDLFIDTDVDTGGVPFQRVDLMQRIDAPVARIHVTTEERSRPIHVPDMPPACRVQRYDHGAQFSVISPTASKEHALGALLDSLDLEFADAIAFGDDHNDVGMIRLAGVGVAMANAVPEVLAVADRVTLSNEQDGVAVVLEELLAG